MKTRIYGLFGAAVLGALATLAIAQTTIPTVVNIGPSDLVGIVKGGNASAQTQFATAAQLNGVVGYSDQGVLATAQSLTFGNSTQLIIARSSGTIATLTLTAAAAPGDGQVECYLNTQTTTAITWNANTGQSITGAPTAGVAATQACMIYEAAAATWYRYR